MLRVSRRLMPHEIAFGALLVVFWIRSAAALGLFDPYPLVTFGLIIINAVLIWAAEREPSWLRWRARLLFYPIAMSVVYICIGRALPLMQARMRDGLLQGIDAAILGGNASLWMQTLVTPALTEFLSFCYMLFIPYLIFSMLWYYLGSLSDLKAFYLGLFIIYGLGMLGYTLVPAAGPCIAMREQFSAPLRGWFFTHWNNEMVRLGSNHVDVFPSLHCAASSFILLFDRAHKRWRYRLFLVPTVGLWFSTIYLRYHYFVDAVAGFALSALALGVVARWERRSSAPSEGAVKSIEFRDKIFGLRPVDGATPTARTSRALEPVESDIIETVDDEHEQREG